MSFKNRAAVVGAIAVALVVSACASSTGASKSSESQPAGTTAEGSQPGSDSAGDGVTVRVASNSNIGVLPVWVAMDTGIFDKYGISVDYTLVDNVGTLPPAVGKSFDIAFITTSGGIAANAQGIPITEVSGAYDDTVDNPNSFVMVKKDSPIKSLADLKGKTVGVLTLTGTLHYATLKLLDDAGVDPSTVNFINVDGPQQAAQLEAGRVDAVETLAPFSDQINAAGGTSLGVPFQALADTVSVIWWGSTPEWAKANADVIANYRKALDEAITSIKNDDAQARTILQKYTKLPETVISQFTFPDFDTAVRAEDIPIWIDVMKKYAGFKGDVDPASVVFNP